ncbi:hypothetical protein BDK51DRAFT_27335 [Blyttiomyces helicus]|uniref:Uncharacterized protein n=1 Tax=Blyttiomyces helicus TaxID=388810 RepID=A0A4P9WAB6_9FUNG|nr:hypothetical protein BDK51DRAFT_27335 [Blyttiomyces helicus]|eukprot:RKO88443.1 hypothetical protein BDK51DRAFT_27335 [Blyttiomyces helicus]
MPDENLPGPVVVEVLALLNDISNKTTLTRDLNHTIHTLAIELENARLARDELAARHAETVEGLESMSDQLTAARDELDRVRSRCEVVMSENAELVERLSVEMEETGRLRAVVDGVGVEREKRKNDEYPDLGELEKAVEAMTEGEEDRASTSSTLPTLLHTTKSISEQTEHGSIGTSTSSTAPAAEPTTTQPTFETAALHARIAALEEELVAAREQRDDLRNDLTRFGIGASMDTKGVVVVPEGVEHEWVREGDDEVGSMDG